MVLMQGVKLDKPSQKTFDYFIEEMEYELVKKINNDLLSQILFETPDTAKKIIESNLKVKADVVIKNGGFRIDMRGRMKMPTNINQNRNSYANANIVSSVSNPQSSGLTTTSGSLNSSYIPNTASTCTSSGWMNYAIGVDYATNAYSSVSNSIVNLKEIEIEEGHEVEIKLPDGSLLSVKKDGSFEVIDTDSKITYKANKVREFNRFINSSDLLQDFIKFLGANGVKQENILNVPIELFVNWLIFKASEQDGEAPPEGVIPTKEHPKMIESKTQQKPRCLCCGRFINPILAEKGFCFCNSKHATKYAHEKLQLIG